LKLEQNQIKSLLHKMSFVCSFVFITSILSGCGGGGAASSTAAATQPNTAVTGLIPTAPLAGAILFADASVLRPMRDKSVWTYRGRSGDIHYSGVTKQERTADGMIESTTDMLGRVTKATLTNKSGNIISTEPVQTGSTELLAVTELRSPVRQGDQYTLWDKSIAKSGIDIDKDKIEDLMETAAYSTVIGNEDVQLADLSTINALRVDTVGYMRFKRSSDGAMSATRTLKQSTWYASGIGIVRVRETAQASLEVEAIDVEEVLVTWDGVTEGYGYTEALQVKLPYTFAAVGLDDHAIVATRSILSTNGIALSVLDKRGAITAIREYPDLLSTDNGSYLFDKIKITRLGSGVALFDFSHQAGPGPRMFVFDGQANLLNGTSGVRLPANSNYRYAAAYDGKRIWLLWISEISGYRKLELCAFDQFGSAIAPSYVLEAQSRYLDLSNMRLSADGGQVIASWHNASVGSPKALRYAVVTSEGKDPLINTFISGNNSANRSDESFRAVASSGTGFFIWEGALLSGTNVYGSQFPDQNMRAVAMNANLDLLRSNNDTVNLEKLPVQNLDGYYNLATNVNGKLLISSPVFNQKFFSDSVTTSTFNELRLYPNNTLALASSKPQTMRIPYDDNNMSSASQLIIPLSDRVLWLSGYNSLMTRVAWIH
jgi:hypothetical protein